MKEYSLFPYKQAFAPVYLILNILVIPCEAVEGGGAKIEGDLLAAEMVEIQGLKVLRKEEILEIAGIESAPPYTFRSTDEVRKILKETGLFKDIEVYFNERESLLLISVEENPVIEKVVFEGVRVVSEEILKKGCETIEGRVLNTRLLDEDVIEIEKFYAAQGYSAARVREVRVEGSTLRFSIDEGVVKRILIEGNRRISKDRLKRWLDLKEGDIYNSFSMKKAQQSAFNSNYFNSLNIDIESLDDGGVEVRVKVQEKPSFILRTSIVARDDLLHGSFERIDKNIFDVQCLYLSGLYETPMVERFSGETSYREFSTKASLYDGDPFKHAGLYNGIEYYGRMEKERNDYEPLLTYSSHRFFIRPGVVAKIVRNTEAVFYGAGGFYYIRENGNPYFFNPTCGAGFSLDSFITREFDVPLRFELDSSILYEGDEEKRTFGKVMGRVRHEKRLFRFHLIKVLFEVESLIGDAPYYEEYILGGTKLRALEWASTDIKRYAYGSLEYDLPVYKYYLYLSPFYEGAAIPSMEDRWADLLDSFGFMVHYRNLGIDLATGYAMKLYDLSFDGRFFFSMTLDLFI